MWPNLRVNLQAELVDKVEGDNLVEHTFAEQEDQSCLIGAMEVYEVDDKQTPRSYC